VHTLPPVMAALTRVSTVLTFAAVMIALSIGLAPNVDTRIVQIGERLWPGYGAELREDPAVPDCDLAALDEQATECVPSSSAPTELGDPFADTPPPPEPDPFADGPAAGPNCNAVKSLRDTCATRHTEHDRMVARITGPVRAFRSVELILSDVARFPWWKHLLVLMVLLGGVSTQANRMAIAIREAGNLAEHRVAQVAQLLAHVTLAASAVADWNVQQHSTAEIEHPELALMWAVGFVGLSAINVFHLVRPPHVAGAPFHLGRLPMVIPLYAYMAIIGAVWFQLVERHPSGQAIFLQKFLQTPSIYLGIGLYLWAGMLLARTRITQQIIDMVLPWALPGALLAWIVGVAGAVPTAYSGASGIFVLAAGSVIYARLRDGGASPRIAFAATAMSGSLGVVLRPCLVVVLIAALNKSVTTAELYGWGLYVFLLTATLYFVAMWLRKDRPVRLPPLADALGRTFEALETFAPHIVIVVVMVFGFYGFLLGTGLNEYTAPLVVPGMLLVSAIWDHRAAGPRKLWESLKAATAESSDHTGALLGLMCCSVVIGGVVERSEIMDAFPSEFGSPLAAMAVLTVVKVLLGMVMDPMGAIILVSVTLAHVATENGISPVHFWMMVLVAFELGYLLPPVALNQILARKVVGARVSEIEDDPGSFAARYEHVLIPVAVMATALVIVAFGPLLVGYAR
jgi:TRAP-type C4-dicarboxylate transport system permease large subunit